MFGINDNEDKKDGSQETTTPDAPASTDTSSPPPVDQTIGNTAAPAMPAVIQPTSDSSATTPPPFAVPLDTSQTAPIPPPVSPEAILSPITEQAATAPPTAEATMAEDSGMEGVHLEDSLAPTSPIISNKHQPSDNKPSVTSLISGGPQADDLLKLKQEALHSLAPLVDQLDQSPEEKFKTTMMLIQASDNADLVHEAYDAANKIPDEKARAQALLDVVNEINYFTQHHEPQ